jgi:hypothetical protein
MGLPASKKAHLGIVKFLSTRNPKGRKTQVNRRLTP